MPVLERAEAYLPEHPDSVGMLLDSISSRPLGDSGERVRALYGLLRTRKGSDDRQPHTPVLYLL